MKSLCTWHHFHIEIGLIYMRCPSIPPHPFHFDSRNNRRTFSLSVHTGLPPYHLSAAPYCLLACHSEYHLFDIYDMLEKVKVNHKYGKYENNEWNRHDSEMRICCELRDNVKFLSFNICLCNFFEQVGKSRSFN